MRRLSTLVATTVLLGGAVIATGAVAQNQRPTHIPTPQAKDSPFGTEWAKPPGTTGSRIYDDPRNNSRNAPYNPNPNRNCSAPTMYDPVAGRCK